MIRTLEKVGSFVLITLKITGTQKVRIITIIFVYIK